MNLLQDYYHIHVNKKDFIYKDKHYCLIPIDHIKEFEYIYSIYLYYMNLSHIIPYTIIYNKDHQIHSNNHILFTYQQQKINIQQYLYTFIKPLPQKIYIHDIKKQWINKSNELRQHQSKNIEIVSLIYYYTGIIEYCITLLNHLLCNNYYCCISLTLSLKHCIDDTKQLINPSSYIISSRIRHIVLLLKSHIIEIEDLSKIIKQNILSYDELYYLVACILYPHDIDISTIKSLPFNKHLQNINKMIKLYHQIYDLMNKKFSIAKISWLNEENMI